MKTITEVTTLYVEDTAENYNFYSRIIQRILEEAYGIRLHYKWITDVDAALEELKVSPMAQRAVIVDMLFKQPGRRDHAARGLEVVRAASKISNLVIICLSHGDIEGYPDLEREAKQLGGHVFRLHSHLNDRGGWERFGEDIYSALLEEKVVLDGIELKAETDDPRLQYIISEVGELTLKRLYVDLLGKGERPVEIRASYVAPGLSGAMVLHCEARRPGAMDLHHLLKVNRQEDILLREVRSRPAGGYRSGLFIDYLPANERGLPNRGGWYAIAAVFEGQAKTLRAWLSTVHGTNGVEDVMHSLFLEGGLAKGYGQDLTVKEQPTTEALGLSLSRQSRALVAINELDSLMLDLLGQATWSVTKARLRRYLTKGSAGALERDQLKGNARLCQCHRDLHAANVLVRSTKAPSVVIIDTAEIGKAHWATDYARLGVDILLSTGRDASCYYFEGLKRWRLECLAFITRRTTEPPEITEDASSAAIQWMVHNYHRVFPFAAAAEARFGWEWTYALAGEFLRAAYRTELPAPKRAAALIAASDSVEAAESAYSAD